MSQLQNNALLRFNWFMMQNSSKIHEGQKNMLFCVSSNEFVCQLDLHSWQYGKIHNTIWQYSYDNMAIFIWQYSYDNMAIFIYDNMEIFIYDNTGYAVRTQLCFLSWNDTDCESHVPWWSIPVRNLTPLHFLFLLNKTEFCGLKHDRVHRRIREVKSCFWRQSIAVIAISLYLGLSWAWPVVGCLFCTGRGRWNKRKRNEEHIGVRGKKGGKSVRQLVFCEGDECHRWGWVWGALGYKRRADSCKCWRRWSGW